MWPWRGPAGPWPQVCLLGTFLTVLWDSGQLNKAGIPALTPPQREHWVLLGNFHIVNKQWPSSPRAEREGGYEWGRWGRWSMLWSPGVFRPHTWAPRHTPLTQPVLVTRALDSREKSAFLFLFPGSKKSGTLSGWPWGYLDFSVSLSLEPGEWWIASYSGTQSPFQQTLRSLGGRNEKTTDPNSRFLVAEQGQICVPRTAF